LFTLGGIGSTLRQTNRFARANGEESDYYEDTIYNISGLKDIDGQLVNMLQYKGKVCLIVNVASE